LTSRYARIFSIAAVEVTPHTAHRGSDDVALVELRSRSLLDRTNCFGAEDTREYDAGRKTLPGE
jgi:hypothetical protein